MRGRGLLSTAVSRRRTPDKRQIAGISHPDAARQSATPRMRLRVRPASSPRTACPAGVCRPSGPQERARRILPEGRVAENVIAEAITARWPIREPPLVPTSGLKDALLELRRERLLSFTIEGDVARVAYGERVRRLADSWGLQLAVAKRRADRGLARIPSLSLRFRASKPMGRARRRSLLPSRVAYARSDPRWRRGQ